MKKIETSMVGIGWVKIALACVLVIGHGLIRSDYRMVFDHPYPQTVFTQGLQACSQLYQLCQRLSVQHVCDDICQCMMDAVVGCSIRINRSLHAFSEQERVRRTVSEDDVCYLVMLIDNLIDMQRSLAPRHSIDPHAIDNLIAARKACEHYVETLVVNPRAD